MAWIFAGALLVAMGIGSETRLGEADHEHRRLEHAEQQWKVRLGG